MDPRQGSGSESNQGRDGVSECAAVSTSVLVKPGSDTPGCVLEGCINHCRLGKRCRRKYGRLHDPLCCMPEQRASEGLASHLHARFRVVAHMPSRDAASLRPTPNWLCRSSRRSFLPGFPLLPLPYTRPIRGDREPRECWHRVLPLMSCSKARCWITMQ